MYTYRLRVTWGVTHLPSTFRTCPWLHLPYPDPSEENPEPMDEPLKSSALSKKDDPPDEKPGMEGLNPDEEDRGGVYP